jgi:signal transduction histidine kinase
VRAATKTEHRTYLDRFGMHSILVAPLLLRGQVIGTIGIARDAPGRPYSADDQSLLQDLAERAARTIENARLYQTARAAEDRSLRQTARMRVLAEAARAFAEADLNPASVLAALTRHVADAIGDVCIIRLLSDDAEWLLPAAVHHPDPAMTAFIRDVLERARHRAGEGFNGRVARSGLPLLLPVLPPEDLRAGTKPEYEAYHGRIPTCSLLIVPMRARGSIIGTVALSRLTPDAPYTAEDRDFLQDLADRAALAVDHARLYAAERAARTAADAAARRADFLAEASSTLASSLDIPRNLTSVARLAVAGFATYCLVDLVTEDGRIERIVAEHRDPARADLMRALRRFPPLVREPSLPAQAITSGAAVLITEFPADFLERATRGPEHLTLVRTLAPRSVISAPLIARDRTLGAMLFARAHGVDAFNTNDLALAEELARRAALAVDNARLYEEAQRALRLREEFLSAVSHDLRTPLTTVKGYAQMLRRRAVSTGEDSVWLARGLANIDVAASKMTGLVGELLDIARLQSGRPLDLNRAPADLVALARQAIADQHVDERHELRVETAVESLTGLWDAMRLERVLANLLSNAIKYSPDGGPVTIEINENKTDGEWAVLTVRDRGIGIPARDLPHIFERFHRGSNVVGSIDGVGLGLAGVRRIVEQHGGTISIESDEGAGTAVTVRLPL